MSNNRWTFTGINDQRLVIVFNDQIGGINEGLLFWVEYKSQQIINSNIRIYIRKLIPEVRHGYSHGQYSANRIFLNQRQDTG